MADWKNILIELARKITAPLAFAVLLIAALGQFGEKIPTEYTRLVYAVGLGSLLIWALQELARILRPGHARSRALKTMCYCRVSGGRFVWVWRARKRRWRVVPGMKPVLPARRCARRASFSSRL